MTNDSGKIVFPVSEIFGPTIQGEGPSVGKNVAFVRLMGCNQHCVWCDTPYTWRFTDTHPHEQSKVYNRADETTFMTIDEIYSKINEMAPVPGTIVISGGEPMLHVQKLNEFIGVGWQSSQQFVFEVETAGTIKRSPTMVNLQRLGVVRFNISPKLASSGNSKELRYNENALADFARGPFTKRQNSFKFVVGQVDELDEVAEIVESADIPRQLVYVMPLGIEADTINERIINLAQAVIDRGWNLTPRLHVTLWGNKRGV